MITTFLSFSLVVSCSFLVSLYTTSDFHGIASIVHGGLKMDIDSSDMKRSVDQAGFAFCTVISRYIIDYIHTIVSLPEFKFIQIFLEQKIASRKKRNFFITDHKQKPLSQR